MDKDVTKLRVVTERFSSIGSTPVIQPENVYQIVEEALAYLRPRISTKVEWEIQSDSKELIALLNKPLPRAILLFATELIRTTAC
jgi:hypothetical protein